MSQLDANIGGLFGKLQGWINGFITLIPNLIAASIVLLIGWGISWLVMWSIRKTLRKRGRPALANVGGSLIGWGILILTFLLAMTIVLPSLKPGDMLAGLGIGSVAIGFAFKDILQNILSGVLILLHRPFKVGDQIEAAGYEGTVEDIQTRATTIRTYDNCRVVIPNSDVYTAALVVNTAYDKRRSQYDVGIGYADDWDEARDAILTSISGLEGVEADPAPEVLPWGIDASQLTVRIRWWTQPQRSSVVHTHARVIRAVSNALDEAAIDMPYPTNVMLFHDQTEETDGKRGNQREGWPAGKNPPRSRREVDDEARAAREKNREKMAEAEKEQADQKPARDE
ncbi:mechanosensitive ion channel family protein [Paracoccus tegillarcae]|uniref:Small-conductance mechanosensitive channel n=1 Tax=Paracoccus tegillarcae TaxID=1529068 RepID=A0A2K9F426_9RHOB|nr:mechanosensitive ion channel family protein [Paracoccus tegillarcae]